MIAAHEPYLLTLNRTALVLWNRRKPEPFSVSKEAYVQKMIILAENLEVPGKSSPGGFLRDPCYPALLSVFSMRNSQVSSNLYQQWSQPTVRQAFCLTLSLY